VQVTVARMVFVFVHEDGEGEGRRRRKKLECDGFLQPRIGHQCEPSEVRQRCCTAGFRNRQASEGQLMLGPCHRGGEQAEAHEQNQGQESSASVSHRVPPCTRTWCVATSVWYLT